MDRINTNPTQSASIPINHAINAYTRAAGTRAISPTARPRPMMPIPSAPLAKIGPVGAAQGTAVGKRVDSLVAGQVDPINLTTDVNAVAAQTPSIQPTAMGTYSMHPVAADRNQAATGVAVGRSLDIQG